MSGVKICSVKKSGNTQKWPWTQIYLFFFNGTFLGFTSKNEHNKLINIKTNILTDTRDALMALGSEENVKSFGKWRTY